MFHFFSASLSEPGRHGDLLSCDRRIPAIWGRNWNPGLVRVDQVCDEHTHTQAGVCDGLHLFPDFLRLIRLVSEWAFLVSSGLWSWSVFMVHGRVRLGDLPTRSSIFCVSAVPVHSSDAGSSSRCFHGFIWSGSTKVFGCFQQTPPTFTQSFHLSLSSCITSLEQLLLFLHNFCLFSLTVAIFICSDVILSAAEIAVLSSELYQKYQGILWRSDKENTVTSDSGGRKRKNVIKLQRFGGRKMF